MPAYRYVAISRDGELTRGRMEAPSEAVVVERLRRQGSLPMSTEPDRGGTGSFLTELLGAELGRGGAALRRQELTDFTRELSVMLAAGQDLDRALRFVVETASSQRMRGVTERVRDAVRDGSQLAAALAQQRRSFPALYVGLVRAGEAGGTLAATLDSLATLLDRERSLAASIHSALMYPLLLVAASIGSIAFLLTYVLPQFIPLFEQNGAELPGPTRMLMALGDAVSSFGAYALLAFGLLLAAAQQVLRRPAPRLAADRLLLRMPVIGPLGREALAARFGRTLGTLLLNGVPLDAALGVVRDALGNRAAVAAVESATASAKGGTGLAGSLDVAGVFPSRLVHLLRLGEETARLGPMALRAAEIHEERTRIGLQRLVSLLTPAITIVMGAAVAGIVASLLLAMLSLNDLAR